VLAELIWFSDTHMVECLGRGDECPQRDFRFRIKTIVVKWPMIGWQWKDNLRGGGDNLMARLLSFDSTKETQKVHKHETACELRLAIGAIDLMAILKNGSERDDIVEIVSKCHIHVVNKRLRILFRGLVEENDSKSTASETSETAITRSGDDNMAPPDERPRGSRCQGNPS